MYKIFFKLLKSNQQNNNLVDYFSWGKDKRLREGNDDVMQEVNDSWVKVLKGIYKNEYTYKLLIILLTYKYKK